MLGYLSQQLGLSPKAEEKKARKQMTLDTMFANIKEKNASKESSTPPSLTTASTATERSSEPVEDYATSGLSMTSSFTSNSTTRVTPRSELPALQLDDTNLGSEEPELPSTPLIMKANDSQETLVRKSMDLLQPEWELGALPGDELNLSPSPKKYTSPRKQRAPGKFFKEQVGTMVDKAKKTVLGKRARKDSESASPMKRSTNDLRRTSSRLQEVVPRTSEEPAAKKPKISLVKEETANSTLRTSDKATKKPVKQWVNQGLYVGQDRRSKAKLPGIQKQTGEDASDENTKQPRENKLLPRPMFVGEMMINRDRDFKLPYDVFSPLTDRQPAPDEWRKQQKNTLIGDAKHIWKKTRHTEESMCGCKPETGCGENCHNAIMFYECDENNCSLPAEKCGNRAFADLQARKEKHGRTAKELYNTGVEVLLTEDRGYGIRANRTFEPSQIIVEYSGEIITQDEADDRMRNKYKDAACYYLMDFDQGMILDATKGSIARFVNHSCEPNCRMIKWTVKGEPRMALFAGDRGIMTGEELTYDYNFNPFSMKNTQTCRCGTDRCRGFLGPKPKETKETKEIKEALKPIVNNGKRNFTEIYEDVKEGVKEVVNGKRRKINKPKSLKDLPPNMYIPKSNNPETKKPQAKMLPKGWVIPSEAQPVRNVNNDDPEALMKAMREEKRKRKAATDGKESIEGGKLAKKARLTTVKEEEIDDEAEDVEMASQVMATTSVKEKAKSAKDSVVKSMRKGGKRSSLLKSARTVEDIDEEEEDL
ncbi:uncharacterized protein KY384_001110 [Bacidia gigantensis]|uniref:uncharacterized protein n=1 Tax=Bacidia gigantensis TaxID=2732470 RepID=UPI001D059250|nr:uncharacterized protein KY384_001110 [Bacidia gigantensis]KAG8534266.1 hypothetical protein KY384_001110 [Bacidia gigantensis]